MTKASRSKSRRVRRATYGSWMPHLSDESGQYQVYVQTIPAGGAKFQISTGGGTQPAWRRDGKELYYLAPDHKLMAVSVKFTGTSFDPGTLEALFAPNGASYF